jgi:hypothetical protein
LKLTATVTRVAKAVVVAVDVVDVVAVTVDRAKTTPAETSMVMPAKDNWALLKPAAIRTKLAQHSHPRPTVLPHHPATKTLTDVDPVHATATAANELPVPTAASRAIATSKPQCKPPWKWPSSLLPWSRLLLQL